MLYFDIDREGNLLLPVLTLENEHGRKVVFIGMIHLATISFYTQVITYLEELSDKGFAVLYEDVQDLRNPSETRIERKIWRSVGCDEQTSAIPIRPAWIPADSVGVAAEELMPPKKKKTTGWDKSRQVEQ